MTAVDAHASLFSGRTGAQTYADFLSYLATIQASGFSWGTIAVILYPVTGPEFLAYQALMVANATTNGITIIDMRGESNLWVYPAYSNLDGHSNVPGYKLWKPYLIPFIQNELNSAAVRWTHTDLVAGANNAEFTTYHTTFAPGTATAPDGSTAAAVVTEDNAGSFSHELYTGTSPLLPAVGVNTYTVSVYAKPKPGTVNRALRLHVYDPGVGDSHVAWDLTTGVFYYYDIGTGGMGTPANITSTPAANGFTRYSFTFTTSATQTTFGHELWLLDISGAFPGLPTYAGDGTSGVVAWGLKIDAGSVATPIAP
jgi:hypothetical protein